jgi:hypothetical protein
MKTTMIGSPNAGTTTDVTDCTDRVSVQSVKSVVRFIPPNCCESREITMKTIRAIRVIRG